MQQFVERVEVATAERKQQTVALLDDGIRLDGEIREIKRRITVAVAATRTSLLDIYGAGRSSRRS